MNNPHSYQRLQRIKAAQAILNMVELRKEMDKYDLDALKKQASSDADPQPGTDEFNNALHQHLYGKDMPEKHKKKKKGEKVGYDERIKYAALSLQYAHEKRAFLGALARGAGALGKSLGRAAFGGPGASMARKALPLGTAAVGASMIPHQMQRPAGGAGGAAGAGAGANVGGAGNASSSMLDRGVKGFMSAMPWNAVGNAAAAPFRQVRQAGQSGAGMLGAGLGGAMAGGPSVAANALGGAANAFSGALGGAAAGGARAAQQLPNQIPVPPGTLTGQPQTTTFAQPQMPQNNWLQRLMQMFGNQFGGQ